jgi:hypothetical protein
MESNAIERVLHHMELTATSELRADITPKLRNAPQVIMAGFVLKRNFRLKSFILKLSIHETFCTVSVRYPTSSKRPEAAFQHH